MVFKATSKRGRAEDYQGMARLRKATAEDRHRLVELMAEFYMESRYALDRQRAGAAFAELLSSDDLGCVWLIRADAEDVGYVVMTLGYSMEYGGRTAFVDDLFVRPAFRSRGLGKAAMAEVRVTCEALGVQALHLEVGRGSATAQALYRQAGFVETDRQLLTLRLADPTHEATSRVRDGHDSSRGRVRDTSLDPLALSTGREGRVPTRTAPACPHPCRAGTER